jgi:hypothetical protein
MKAKHAKTPHNSIFEKHISLTPKFVSHSSSINQRRRPQSHAIMLKAATIIIFVLLFLVVGAAQDAIDGFRTFSKEIAAEITLLRSNPTKYVR